MVASIFIGPGMAALLLQRYKDFRWHPELVKAAFLAAGVKDVYDHGEDVDQIISHYHGRITDLSLLLKSIVLRHSIDDTEKEFDNGPIVLPITGVKKGTNYRFAISWLSSGSFIKKNGRIGHDIDLYIMQGDKILVRSESGNNPFEVVDFTAGNNMDFNIVIKRYQAFNKNERIVLGVVGVSY